MFCNTGGAVLECFRLPALREERRPDAASTGASSLFVSGWRRRGSVRRGSVNPHREAEGEEMNEPSLAAFLASWGFEVHPRFGLRFNLGGLGFLDQTTLLIVACVVGSVATA